MRLELHNFWGEYHLAPVGTPQDQTMSWSRDFRPTRVRVVWPDGTPESFQVVTRERVERVLDGNASYTMKSTMYGIEYTHHGLTQWVGLENFADVTEE